METASLKALIKESIREVLQEERLSLIPSVNAQEMKEISQKFGTPDNYNENDFVDMTDWLNDDT